MADPIDRASSYLFGVALGDNLVGLFTGEVDPSVSGFVAPVGSTYFRGGDNGGSIWKKTAAGDTAWTEVGAGGGGFDPGKTVIVAKTGGDYASVKDALDYVATQSPSASNAWAVVVYPGIYTEAPMTVPAYCNLNCAAPAGSAVLVASTTTSPLVTMGGYSSMTGFLVQGASGSGGIGIYCPSTCTNYILQNNIISNCETGIKIVGAGTPVSTVGNILSTQLSRAPGQTMVTAIDASAGALVAVSPIVIFGTPASMITTGLHVDGAIFQGAGISCNYCTVGSLVEGQSVFSHSAAHYRSCATALAVDDAGTNSKCNSTVIEGCTVDIDLRNAGVTGYFAGSLDILKTNIADADGFYIQSFFEKPGEGGFKIAGDMDVGRHNRPSRAAFGGGGPTTEDQHFLTNTNGTSGTWNDLSTTSKLYGGSFSIFAGTGAGNCAYVGSHHAVPAIGFDEVTTAINVGSGSVIAEYWNGSSWVPMEIIQTVQGTSYASQALAQTGSNPVIRFGQNTGWASTTLNGISAYWARWRVVTAITTIPVVSRLLHFASSMVVGGKGFVTYFGDGEPERQIPITGLIDVLSFASLDEDISAGPNTGLALVNNQRGGNAKDGSGGFFTIPQGLDTSKPIIFTFGWYPDDNRSGDVETEVYICRKYPGASMTGSLVERTGSTIDTITGQGEKEQRTEVSILIPNALADETYYWAHVRDGSSGNPDDTYPDNIYLTSWSLRGTFWR